MDKVQYYLKPQSIC